MHGNRFIFLFPQVMKQTGGLYPAPLKILEVSLVVIIINFNADFFSRVINFKIQGEV